jgi:hypothetical protein
MKWEIYGMPFSPHQSSCSNMKPRLFSWEDVQGDVELWIDVAIEVGMEKERRRAKKCAWLCESRSIVPFFSKLYTTDEEGNFKVDGITPALQKLINAYDVIFTCDKELVELHDKIQFCFAGSTLPWIHKEKWDIHYKEGSSMNSFISSNKNMCKGHQLRYDLYERIKEECGPPSIVEFKEKYTLSVGDIENIEPPIHVFGSITNASFGVNKGCHLKDGSDVWHDKSEGLIPYMYSIVLENDKYPSYFTEKLTDCFVTGTIPIYRGAPDIGDYFDTSGMIIVDSIDDIMNVLRELNDKGKWRDHYLTHKHIAMKNFHKVTFLESPDDMLYRKIITE